MRLGRTLPTSLTHLLSFPSVRVAFRQHFTQTTPCVTAINRAFVRSLIVSPGKWVQQGRYGIAGTAFDYAIGSIWARRSLDPVLERVRKVVSRNSSRLGNLYSFLETLLRGELPRVRRSLKGDSSLDFFRGLGFLAGLDALSRAPVPPPDWVFSVRRVKSQGHFLDLLRRHYPSDFAQEIQALLVVATQDLPRGKRVVYNPIFGGIRGVLPIGSDGDLIIDDLLLELKVSKDLMHCEHLWQLLSYSAFETIRGKIRIRRIGYYNPRYRALWTGELNDAVVQLGGSSFPAFVTWLNDNGKRLYDSAWDSLVALHTRPKVQG